jgi:hypothetical protein
MKNCLCQVSPSNDLLPVFIYFCIKPIRMRSIVILIAIFLSASFVLFIACSRDEKVKTRNTLTQQKLKGKVKSVKSTTYEKSQANGELRATHVNIEQYDRNGYEVESLLYNAGNALELKMKFVFKYNDQGNLVENCRYDPDNRLVMRFTGKFDERGFQTENYQYLADGKMNAYFKMKYDERGNKTEELYYGADGVLKAHGILKYDERGNEIERSTYGPDNKMTVRLIHKFDETNRIIEDDLYDENGTLRVSSRYTYDEIDKEGNWIKKTSRGMNSFSVVKREIEYY